MTSFGCNEVTYPGFNPSFKIQGQVYYRIGSVVPSMNESSNFVRSINFIDNQKSKVSSRCQIVSGVRSDIVSSINGLLHNDNHSVQNSKRNV